MYELKIHLEVDKFLTRCDNTLRERLKKKLISLKSEPFRYLRHYEGDYFKLRIGDYRALIDVDTSRKIIFVRHLDHRKNIYKKYKK